MLHKIFDNHLVAIRKSKLALKLNKLSYIGMCILERSKYQYENLIMITFKINITTNQNYYSRDTDSLMCQIETEDVYEDFSTNKEMFDLSNYSSKSKYYDNSNILVIGKMKDEIGDAAIQEFVGLKPKMYSFLVDNK